MILEKCLYGMPSAAREWSKCRDSFIMRKFSSDGWSVKKFRPDPCLFVIDKIIDPKEVSSRVYENGENVVDPPLYHDLDDIVPENCHRSWVLIHTDDCDCYGTSLDVLHEINDIMNEEWTTEIVDPSYILGVRRVLDTSDPEGWTITCTMPSFIEDLAAVFGPNLNLDEAHGKRTVGTPFPEGLILTKSSTPGEGEADRNIARGYQRMVGSLLWCVRHVSPICAYGCSRGSVPSECCSIYCSIRTRVYSSAKPTCCLWHMLMRPIRTTPMTVKPIRVHHQLGGSHHHQVGQAHTRGCQLDI